MTNAVTKLETKPTLHFAVSADKCDSLMPFVSDEETRYYLNGIAVHFVGEGRVRLAATDGHRLGVWLDRQACGYADGEWPIIDKSVLSDGYRAAIKTARKQHLTAFEKFWIVVKGTGAKHECSIVYADSAQMALDGAGITMWLSPHRQSLIDGNFPDYRRVVPTTFYDDAAAELTSFNAELLGDFRTALEKSPKTPVSITLIATDKLPGPYLVLSQNDPDFVGVIMPMRLDVKPDALRAAFDDVMSGDKPATQATEADESEAVETPAEKPVEAPVETVPEEGRTASDKPVKAAPVKAKAKTPAPAKASPKVVSLPAAKAAKAAKGKAAAKPAATGKARKAA